VSVACKAACVGFSAELPATNTNAKNSTLDKHNMKHLFLFLFLSLFATFLYSQEDPYLKQAREILRDVPLVDGHNDLAWQLRDKFKNHLNQVDLNNTKKFDPPFHTDIPRLRSGMVGGQFWSVYVPVELKGSDAVQAVLEQIDVVHRFVEKYPESFELAYTSEDIQRIHKKAKVASLIGIEGGHSINNSLAVLRELFRAGARYMTLTHWNNTQWADAATADPQHNGLSPFGEHVVKEMNRLGMLVDLSHVSAQTMNRVLDVAAAPVLFSHSSALAISAHPRNVPDAVLKRLEANGGVVMVNYAPGFVSEDYRKYSAELEGAKARIKDLYLGNPVETKSQTEAWQKDNPAPKVTLQQVADHIDYIRKIAGIDHIGIGSDLDGITSTPVGLEDVSTYPALLAELLRRGYSKEDVKKIAGLNVLRVMKKVGEVAVELQKTTQPDDSLIEEVDTPTVK
jgi:membrane dipeptidase